MEQVKEETKKREQKIKNWLTNKYNLSLLVILIFAFFILLYYFNLTYNQTLWWDEAEYLATAKKWAFSIPYEIHPARPPLFSFLASLFFRVGLGESTTKFFLVLLPAWLVVLFTYLLVKEMYDKKTALLASFITSVSWIHLFYSARLMTDALGLLFGILAFLCFWKGYINNKGKKYIWFIGMFIALSFLCRLIGILYGAFLVLFLFVTERFKPIKNKNLWLIPVFFILTILPYLLWSYVYFGNPFAFQVGYAGGKGIVGGPLGWYMLRHVYDYPELGFFIFFLIGLLTLIPMFLTLDRLILKKDKTYYNDLFMFLSILFILAFFIYFLRVGENRWLIAMSIGIFTISAKGILFAYKHIKRNLGKSLAILILLAVLVFGAYYQLKHTDMIIKIKLDSYKPVKEASLWIKENSKPEDIVMSISYPQTAYYSERETHKFKKMTEEEFETFIAEKKPRYLIASVFETEHPEWSYNPPEKYKNFMIPVKIWYLNEQQTQVALVVYEFRY